MSDFKSLLAFSESSRSYLILSISNWRSSYCLFFSFLRFSISEAWSSLWLRKSYLNFWFSFFNLSKMASVSWVFLIFWFRISNVAFRRWFSMTKSAASVPLVKLKAIDALFLILSRTSYLSPWRILRLWRSATNDFLYCLISLISLTERPMRLWFFSSLLALFKSSSRSRSSERDKGSGCLHWAHISLFYGALTGDFFRDIFLEFRLVSFAESFFPRSFSKADLSCMLFIDMRGCFVSAESLFNLIGVIVFVMKDFDFDLWWKLIVIDVKNLI